MNTDMDMDVYNASCNYTIHLQRPDLGDPPHPNDRSTFFIRFEISRTIVYTTPETTSHAMPVEDVTCEITRAEFSPEWIAYVVVLLLLPVRTVELATDLYLYILRLTERQFFTGETIRVLIDANVPYEYYDWLETAWALNESAEAAGFEAAAKPARGSAIAALEEVSILETADLDSICMVCLEELAPPQEIEVRGGVRVAVRLPCEHVYHKDCIVGWLEISHLCPLCRYAMPT